MSDRYKRESEKGKRKQDRDLCMILHQFTVDIFESPLALNFDSVVCL